MTRIKRGTTANKKRKSLLKRAKGYHGSASTKFRQARERLLSAGANAYVGRKNRKREFRRLWITRINGALDQIGSDINYSTFIRMVADSEHSRLNRKAISEIAIKDIEAFKELVAKVSK